ncbi:carbohydrate-binding module family 13 protein [Collybiopsis luxurians FD-317 M1]|uniref:Unplaced genomic scaffold GYMLUscaffold_55, whole genome shotgun sequence n=1 Tax=Collybiopsis luxurians FD-317 M1 TaxID=944289 RepID=A0A0D0BLZ0_9AGAR|nr:carbohydrate-binding module family 13 protein [Collybiopsis luxurians FD-317 M1]
MSLVHGQAYTIVNTATNTVIDLSGNDNVTVQGYQNNSGYSNQKWVALVAGNGWTFKNVRTGTFLTLQNYCGGSSSRVVSGNIPVVWSLTANAAANTYTVTLPLLSSPLVLDLDSSNAANGTAILAFTPTGNANQIWKFVTS